jgi:hypothetical protein
MGRVKYLSGVAFRMEGKSFSSWDKLAAQIANRRLSRK